jgi:hypothetical protein
MRYIWKATVTQQTLQAAPGESAAAVMTTVYQPYLVDTQNQNVVATHDAIPPEWVTGVVIFWDSNDLTESSKGHFLLPRPQNLPPSFNIDINIGVTGGAGVSYESYINSSITLIVIAVGAYFLWSYFNKK